MRYYHLYVNILQYLINSWIIMGGQARTGNNATASIGGYAEKRLALLTNATETTIATIKIDVMNAAVAPSIIPPYEHSIALISNGGTVNRNGTIVDEMGRESISEALMAPQASPLTSTIAPLLPNKYFASGGQLDNGKAADGQQYLSSLHNNTHRHRAMDNVNGGTPHESIVANNPAKTAATTIKIIPTIVMSTTTARTPKATLAIGSKAKATFATPIQSKKGLAKGQRTDAPMLNYIFDSISTANKHHHHDHKYGPHFEDLSSEGSVSNITVHVGNAVYLNCRISLLQDKTVSWVRRGHGINNLELLTVGKNAYSADPRYKVEFQYPSNWRLKIESVIKDDEGTYECQISTHPPRVIQKNLYVNDPKVIIIDEKGGPLQDKYYEVDSTIQLSCIVRHVAMTTTAVYWSHGERILNYDVDRGGISVKTEILEKGANSTLFIAKVNKSDSGNYTCSINSSHEFTVSVHVLNGESFAELHHGNDAEILLPAARWYLILLILFNIIITIQNRRR